MLYLSIGVETSFLPLNLSEGRGFLQVDWDCFLTYGDFGIFCHVVRSGSWSCVLSWATCRPAALRNFEQELCSALRLGAKKRLAPVESCHGLCKGVVLLVVRDTPQSPPLTSWHWAGRSAWRMREGTVLLDMNWTLTLVHFPQKQHRAKWNCPHIPPTGWAISAFMVKYRTKKPETTQNLLSLKKKKET